MEEKVISVRRSAVNALMGDVIFSLERELKPSQLNLIDDNKKVESLKRLVYKLRKIIEKCEMILDFLSKK